VLGQNSITKGGTLINRSLFKWKGSSIESVTIVMILICSQLPEFSLKDKADSTEGGIVGDCKGNKTLFALTLDCDSPHNRTIKEML
jgi:hypothetical protein